MSVGAATLSRAVSAMLPMTPARDFDVSKRFYIELGFQPCPYGLSPQPSGRRSSSAQCCGTPWRAKF
jgi:hypothetical protein